MKHRDIFRVPARLEQRSKTAKTWKAGNETFSESEDLGWFIVVTLGTQDFAFHCGPDKPLLQTKMINLILEYSVADETK